MTAQPKHPFHKFIELASKPLPSEREAWQRDGSYTDKQTGLRKAEDNSVKLSDISHPDSASSDSKNPQ